ncbi:MAG: response regulator [candidate division WOR-3 bacterium]
MADKKRILVVEDEPNMRELVQARLENAGYEVETAADGYAGLAKYRALKPDLVILDLMLPKLDGYTICRMIKSDMTYQAPVILFSARSAPDDARRGLELGADAFVGKPFEQTLLLAKVQELLGSNPEAPQQVQAQPVAGSPTTEPGLAQAPATGQKEPTVQAQTPIPEPTQVQTPVPAQGQAPSQPQTQATQQSQSIEREQVRSPQAPAAEPQTPPLEPRVLTPESRPPTPEPEPTKPAEAAKSEPESRFLTEEEQAARVRPPASEEKQPAAEPEKPAKEPKKKVGFFQRLFRKL